jgi:hypothetical protein
MGIGDAFGGATLEDGATSGVIAVCIPVQYAPIVSGRWSRLKTHQNVTTLDNALFWNPDSNPKLPFKVDGKFQRYIPFVLPPTTRFPGYQNYRISPSSAGLGQIVGVVQIFLSGRQLYLSYSASVLKDGLSSPYISVIPYILMSIVNLITNTLVGSYTQVTMLPMAHDTLPNDNAVFIAGTTASEYALRMFALKHTLPTPQSVHLVQTGPATGKAPTPPDIAEMDGTFNNFDFLTGVQNLMVAIGLRQLPRLYTRNHT